MRVASNGNGNEVECTECNPPRRFKSKSGLNGHTQFKHGHLTDNRAVLPNGKQSQMYEDLTERVDRGFDLVIDRLDSLANVNGNGQTAMGTAMARATGTAMARATGTAMARATGTATAWPTGTVTTQSLSVLFLLRKVSQRSRLISARVVMLTAYGLANRIAAVVARKLIGGAWPFPWTSTSRSFDCGKGLARSNRRRRRTRAID